MYKLKFISTLLILLLISCSIFENDNNSTWLSEIQLYKLPNKFKNVKYITEDRYKAEDSFGIIVRKSLMFKNIYYYDKFLKLKKRNQYNASGQLESSDIFMYNEKGHLVGCNNDYLNTSSNFQCDNLGRIIFEEHYSDNVKDIIFWHKYDNGGKLIETKDSMAIDFGPSFITTYKYDQFDNKISQEVNDVGQSKTEIKYIFNKDGSQIRYFTPNKGMDWYMDIRKFEFN
jgi:YD repeat-containing protein